MPRLLTVLGFENGPEGKLVESSILRCEAALAYLKTNDVSFLLATGAYGANFNNSNSPHGALLIEEIKKRGGVSSTVSILGHTPTSFTEEDIYCARRAFFDNSCDAITFVTSEFHELRAREIAKVVFRDCIVDFVVAKDGQDIKKKHKDNELQRLSNFKKNKWVALPLYAKGVAFPSDTYTNAMDQYKHSDSISLAVVTAALVVMSYPCTKVFSAEHPLEHRLLSALVFLFCGIVGISLTLLYHRFASFAFTARQVLRGLELAWGLPGFSYNDERRKSDLSRFYGFPAFGSYRILIRLMVTLILIDIIGFLYLFQLSEFCEKIVG